MKSYILYTSQTEYLMEKISKSSFSNNLQIISSNLNKDGKRYFPDGEIYVSLPHAFLKRFENQNKRRGGRIVVLHSGAPNPNEGLVEFELTLQILKDNNIKPEVFFTYFPYGMQDKVFLKGETNVAENLIEKLVNYYKVRRIFIIDPHFEGRKWLIKYPIFSISAIPLLCQMAKEEFGKDVVFISPDKGGARRAKIFNLKKRRVNSYKVKLYSCGLNFKGKTVGVVDDIIETGGTLCKCASFLRENGAKKIIALAVHGVLSKGISGVKKKFDKLYLTNTIQNKEANFDISGLIINSLFRP